MTDGIYGEKLDVLGTLVRSDANDVCLCRVRQTEETCLVWIVKDRRAARRLIGNKDGLPCREMFPCGEYVGMILPWEERRSLERYWEPARQQADETVRLCRDIVSLCMTSRLAFAVLHRVLEKRLINIRRDGTLYFNYDISMDGMQWDCTEQTCVSACAGIVLDILDKSGKDNRRLAQLVQRRAARGRYRSFLDLYRDLVRKKRVRRRRRRTVSDRAKRRLFGCCTVIVCAILALIVAMLLMQLMSGEILFFRIFDTSFEQIGTENLGRWIM